MRKGKSNAIVPRPISSAGSSNDSDEILLQDKFPRQEQEEQEEEEEGGGGEEGHRAVSSAIIATPRLRLSAATARPGEWSLKRL